MSIASDGGKRVEKVSFGKSGDGYIAKRDNDTSFYEIGSSVVDDLQKAAETIKPANAAAK